jgi:hypothetical protein
MLAVDARGDAAASWQFGGKLFATTLEPGRGGWRRAVALASSPKGFAFEDLEFGNTLTISDRGEAFLAFHTLTPAEPVSVASGSARTGRWSQPVRLGEGADVAIASNARGDATVAWIRSLRAPTGPPSGEFVMAAHRSSGGRWARAEQISSNAQRDIEPNVDLDAGGRTTAIWLARGGNVEATETG